MPISSEELAKLAREKPDLKESIDQIEDSSKAKIISGALLLLLQNNSGENQAASENIISSFSHLTQTAQEQIFIKTLEGLDRQNKKDEMFKQTLANLVTLTLVKTYHSPEQFPTNFIGAVFGAMKVEYLVKCLESLNQNTAHLSKPVEGFIIGVIVKVFDSSSKLPDAVRVQAFNEVFKRIPNFMPEFVSKIFQNTPSYLPDATWTFGKAGECFDSVLNGKDIGDTMKSLMCRYISKTTGTITSSEYMKKASPANSVVVTESPTRVMPQKEEIIAKL